MEKQLGANMEIEKTKWETPTIRELDPVERWVKLGYLLIGRNKNMSRMFREWFDECEANYDKLSDEDKKKFDEYLQHEEIMMNVADVMEDVSRRLGRSQEIGPDFYRNLTKKPDEK